ncbi:MAG: nuclear transport factor 2 family protein [Actinomycetota bacterium]
MSALDDRTDVEEVLMRLIRALDERDWDAAASCLTEDFRYAQPVKGAFVSSGEIAGREAFLEMAQSIERRASLVQHYLANVVVRVDGDEAQGWASAFVVHVFGEGETSEVVHSGARMEHTFRRTAGGWKVARLVGVPIWRDARFFGLARGTLAPSGS